MLTGRRAYPRWLVRALVVFAVGMTAFAAVASRQRHSTVNERDQVISQYIALESRNLESSDPPLAMQLALIARRVSRTTEGRSVLLDATAGEMPTRLLGPRGQTALALGDDDHRVAIAYQSAGQVKIYALKRAQLTWLSSVPAGTSTARIDAVAISHSGKLLAVGVSAGRVALWSLGSPAHPRKLATLHAGAGAVHGLGFSPGSTALAAADADGSVQRWSLTEPRKPAVAAPLVAPGRPALQALSYSHTGKTLSAVGRDGTLVTWQAHGSTRPLAVMHHSSATLTAVAYSPDGRWLAAGSTDGVTRVWRLNGQGQPRAVAASLPGPGTVTSLAFSRDAGFVAAGSSGRLASVWSTAGWKRLVTLPHPGGVTSVGFTDGDRRLITSDVAGSTVLWQEPSPSTYDVGSAVTGLSFSLTRPELSVTTAAGRTQQWDVVDEWSPSPSGAWNATPLSAAPAKAYWLVPIPTTTTTTTSATTTTIVAADALRRTRPMTRVTTSMLSPNGQLFVAAGTNGLIYLWNLGYPKGLQLAKTLSGPNTRITRLALSPDGRTLAVATAAGHVWLFGVAAPGKAHTIATLTAAPGKITALAFSPSDTTLVAGSSDGRLTFWHYRPYLAVNRICALSGTPITPSEWKQYVPQHSYNPPCAHWKPPVVPTVTTASTVTRASP